MSSPAKRPRTAAPRRYELTDAQKVTRERLRAARNRPVYTRFSGPGSELKYFDTATSFTVDTTGEVPATGQLVLIPQGDTETTRDGKRCVITSIQARWDIIYNPPASSQGNSVVCITLVQDTQCNGAAAAVTDVFTSNVTTQAMINLDNSNRFRILKKWNLVFNPQAAAIVTQLNADMKHIEYYHKCRIPLVFSGATGAITELKSNNLFLLASGFGVTDDLVTVTGNVRVRFDDR